MTGTIESPIALILLACWIGSVLLVLVLVFQRYCSVYKIKWFDLSKKGPNRNLEWCEVKKVMEGDPLDSQPNSNKSCCNRKNRGPDRFPYKHFFVDLLGVLALLVLLCGSLKLILQIDTDLQNSCDLNYLKSFGILVGGLSVLTGVFSIFYQGRLKARSENRQAWINSIRKEISTLIANFPPHEASNSTIDEAIRKKYEYSLASLELSLNPSERVHRGLLATIRFMYRINDNYFDKEARSELGIQCNSLNDEEEWAKWKANSIRLATVLLKREWEQVKYVK